MTRQPSPPWMATAACLDLTPLMYVDTGGRGNSDAAAAKRVCRSCPHVDVCLEFALERHEQFGVWGAMTAKERRRERARRLREVAA